jgi:ribonuclease VapC
MFIDSSALVAILVAESDADELALKMKDGDPLLTSPLARYEAAVGIARILKINPDDADRVVTKLVTRYGVRTLNVTADIGAAAVLAFDRYGKGRHKARLNMGDCFSYACAKVHRVPLLCKGDDFIHTDIALA